MKKEAEIHTKIREIEGKLNNIRETKYHGTMTAYDIEIKLLKWVLE